MSVGYIPIQTPKLHIKLLLNTIRKEETIMEQQYTKLRNTNIMRLAVRSNPAMYWYRKPTIRNCKVTFADGSVYWQKVLCNDKTHGFKDELNKLYLDEQCTVPANVTRKQKLQECKRAGLI